MNRIFGKNKAKVTVPVPTLDDASAGIGGRVDKMDEKILSLDNELKRYKDKLKTTKSAAAKKNIQKRAMEVLKRKRMYEQQRDNMAGQQFNIDQAAFGIESAKSTVETVAAMKIANTELKKTVKNDLNLDDIDDLADDMADMMEDMNEINEGLARNFSTPEDIDEADLEAELDMLEDEIDEEDIVGDEAPSYLLDANLPSQPTNALGDNINAEEPLANTLKS